MLLDGLNTSFTDQAYARHQMLAFVKEQFKPGERMAVFALTGPLSMMQDFTSDPQILYTALQRYKAQPQDFASSGRPATSLGSGRLNFSSKHETARRSLCGAVSRVLLSATCQEGIPVGSNL
jgi:hypothetical protein